MDAVLRPDDDKTDFRLTTISSPLCIAEDEFQPHHTPHGTTLVLPYPSELIAFAWIDTVGATVLRIITDVGLTLTSHGWTHDGYAITFACKSDAAKFRLFYDSEVLVG